MNPTQTHRLTLRRLFAAALPEFGAPRAACGDDRAPRDQRVRALLQSLDLAERRLPAPPPGHPVDSFRREHGALREQVAAFRAAFSVVTATCDPLSPPEAEALATINGHLETLQEVDRHFQRLEQLLFPHLEHCGLVHAVLLAIGRHDEIRAGLRLLGEEMAACCETVAQWRVIELGVAAPAFDDLEGALREEEELLLPLALQLLAETEWAEIWARSSAIGYCLIEPATAYDPRADLDDVVPPEVATEAQRRGTALALPLSNIGMGKPSRDLVLFPSGALDVDQLHSILTVLPLDIVFVDASDRVRYVNDRAGRVFPLARTVIGRKVQHCHPPASVATIARLLDDLRTGRQDDAQFWIELDDRFVLIRYLAVRDREGRYQGALELVQDLTRERALEGERRELRTE